jgi:ssDNA-binding Zn-finger/Zn-ribbon topoisomerase 1
VSEDKKILDVSDFKEVNIECADCGKELLRMLRVEKSETEFEITANCPYCNGSSWANQLKGRYYQNPPDGLGLGDMTEEDGNFILNMEKIK